MAVNSNIMNKQQLWKHMLCQLIPADKLTSFANLISSPIVSLIKRLQYPDLEIRPGTSDMAVFRKIFLQREYSLECGQKPKLIIDGGANVGYASIFFAHKYPSAHIIAIEPEKRNYQMPPKTFIITQTLNLSMQGYGIAPEILSLSTQEQANGHSEQSPRKQAKPATLNS